MREISPAINLSADEYLELLPAGAKEIVLRIRHQKCEGTRPRPSSELVDRSTLLTAAQRRDILDVVAALVDENLSGRSDMCRQFADLLRRALVHLQLPARVAIGQSIYFGSSGRELYRWRHAWVRVGKEVIDGNIDCLRENPMVPTVVKVSPYWGPITETPADRKLQEDRGGKLDPDTDVTEIWWPELRDWLDEHIRRWK